MKAVILAAGEGKRMLPLTKKTPKSLLRIGNKTIIDYIFDSLPKEVEDVIIVVGYLKKQMRQYLGNKYQGHPIRYVEQEILDGTATALLCVKDLFKPKERFMIIYGDELPTIQEINKVLSCEFSCLCCPSPHPTQSGIVQVDNDDNILEIVEKPERPSSNMCAAGIMVLNSDIFNCKPLQHQNGDYYLTSMMNEFFKNHAVKAVYGRERPGFLSPDEIEKINPIKLTMSN